MTARKVNSKPRRTDGSAAILPTLSAGCPPARTG